MARELHMTVEFMLNNMSQKELCNWIAFFRLENEEYEDRKEERRDKVENARIKIKQKDNEPSQLEKDKALMNQLLQLAAN